MKTNVDSSQMNAGCSNRKHTAVVGGRRHRLGVRPCTLDDSEAIRAQPPDADRIWVMPIFSQEHHMNKAFAADFKQIVQFGFE